MKRVLAAILAVGFFLPLIAAPASLHRPGYGPYVPQAICQPGMSATVRVHDPQQLKGTRILTTFTQM